MEHYYYINKDGKEEGPHDLVTIMRRIRTQAITPETKFFLQGEEQPTAAHLIPELASFFNRPVEDMRQELGVKSRVSVVKVLQNGWQFVSEHQVMPVMAGAVVLLSSLVVFLVEQIMGEIAAGIVGFGFFFVLQCYFVAFSLRLSRGQNLGLEFIEQKFAPISGKLSLVALMLSIMVVFGLVLLVVPALLIILASFFVSMIMIDYNNPISVACKKSFLILKKLDSSSMINLMILMLIYLCSVALILPIPLMLPIIAGGMCRVYEDIAAA